MYISPVYVYECRNCGAVFTREYAPGFGGPYCNDCFSQTCDIIARDYANGTVVGGDEMIEYTERSFTHE